MWNAIESFFEIKVYNVGLRTAWTSEIHGLNLKKTVVVELMNAWDEIQTEMKIEKQKQNFKV